MIEKIKQKIDSLILVLAFLCVFNASKAQSTPYVAKATVSPNGELLATVLSSTNNYYDTLATIWNSKTGEKKFTLDGHKDAISSICFSNDGKLIATGASDKTIKLWSTETGSLIKTISGNVNAPTQLQFSPDNNFIANTDEGNPFVVIWDVNTGKFVRVVGDLENKKYSFKIHQFEFSPDLQTMLLVIGNGGYKMEGKVEVWNWNQGETGLKISNLEYPELNILTGKWEQENVKCKDALFINNGSQILSITSDGRFSKTHSISDYKKNISEADVFYGAANTSNYNFIAADWINNGVIIMQNGNKNPYKILQQHSDNVRHIMFSKNDQYFITIGDDGKAFVYNNKYELQGDFSVASPKERLTFEQLKQESLENAVDYKNWTLEKIEKEYASIVPTKPNPINKIYGVYYEMEEGKFLNAILELSGTTYQESKTIVGILKVRKFWNVYKDLFNLEWEFFQVKNGNILKALIAMPSNYIGDIESLVKDFGCEINFKDTFDGKSVLEYCADMTEWYMDTERYYVAKEYINSYNYLKNELGALSLK